MKRKADRFISICAFYYFIDEYILMTERVDEGSEVEIEPRICGRSVKNIFKNAYGCKMNGYTLYLRCIKKKSTVC